MSYKSKKQDRMKRSAINRDQSKAHQTGSASENWYLTLAKTPCSCNEPGCGRHFRASRPRHVQEIVYRKSPMTIYCLDCAIKKGLPYRPSRSWEESRSSRQKAVSS